MGDSFGDSALDEGRILHHEISRHNPSGEKPSTDSSSDEKSGLP
jgi:hypothetical protein